MLDLTENSKDENPDLNDGLEALVTKLEEGDPSLSTLESRNARIDQPVVVSAISEEVAVEAMGSTDQPVDEIPEGSSEYMKYLIVTLIKGNAEKYHQDLLYSIAKKFDISGAIMRKPPAHVTLKYSFYSDDIEPVEDCLERFCKSHKSFTYRMKGVGHFTDRVIFVDVTPSKKIKKLYFELLDSLKSIIGLQFDEFDGKTHFHASIAHTDIKEKFEKIWACVSKELPDFEVEFDNISILKLVDGKWEVHKEFHLV